MLFAFYITQKQNISGYGSYGATATAFPAPPCTPREMSAGMFLSFLIPCFALHHFYIPG
jgi:hypothetical protein